MSIPTRLSYQHFVKSLKQSMNDEEAMKLAIGDGDFDAIGILERELLIDCGLAPDHYLIDVGCGSGRLAKPLARYLTGKYLGIDIVKDLVEYARNAVNRPDWQFVVAKNELQIPEKDSQADMVCFFSVITHLLHEQSYIYLQEAKRVLKPGGKIVFSFLEFKIDAHWHVFEETIKGMGHTVMNQFISRDGIMAWAKHLDLTIESIHDGDKPHFLLSEPVVLGDGQIFTDQGHLGQSVCILSKPATDS